MKSMRTEGREHRKTSGAEKNRSAVRPRKIGVFGGSFNPIHNGHLEIAKIALKACGLSEVWFIPAGDPYMKSSVDILPGKKRFELTERAISGFPAFRADPVEIRRKGPSYTVDTLEELGKAHPDCRFFLIVGEDAFRQMPLWKEPEKILQYAEIIVAGRRSGKDVPEYDTALLPIPPGRLHRIEADIRISSTEIRRRIAEGSPISGMVPAAIEEETENVYREFFAGTGKQAP